MEGLTREPSFCRKKMTKQLTGKRDDSALHSAARAGNLGMVMEVLSSYNGTDVGGLKELLSKQNEAGETALYVAAEYGYVDVVKELLKYSDGVSASIKAKNGYDAFHIAAKQGDIEILKGLLQALPELAMTVNLTNSTALHTAANQGHVDVVNLLLEADASLAKIARSNGKTALHSAVRNGYLAIVKALLCKEPGIITRIDKKGQTALHMAVKGHNLEVVEELLKFEPMLINMVDTRGNTALHTATVKGRAQIVRRLLDFAGTSIEVVNKVGETALDIAEKSGNMDLAATLRQYGVGSGRSTNPPSATRVLKQTVSDIKHGVHSQLEHSHQTVRRVQGIAKKIKKLHSEGLNNAINSTTVVAVLIATVAFAAIFVVPGQYVEDLDGQPPSVSLGQANVAADLSFQIFFVFDSIALFISLAVVVVQTSVVIIDNKAKKQMMAVINKLMWLACVFISVAFVALSFIVVGHHERSLAIGVAVIGTLVMATTLGTLCYWVVMHMVEDSNRGIRRSSLSRSMSMSISRASPSEYLDGDHTMYAI